MHGTATTSETTSPPPWATATWEFPSEVVHDGQSITLTAPNGEPVAQANLSRIVEPGYDTETTMVLSGGGFASFPAASTPQFTRALRSWADQLDAEALKAVVR